jgi:ribose-phosphate pyrophosphokinase
MDALRRASASSITAVLPYFGYSRQEKKTTGREPLTTKLVANLLTVAGADRLVTIDMHDPAIQGFFDIPVDHLSAAKILAQHLLQRDLTNFIIVAPDTGGVHRAREFAKRLKLPMAIIDKRRPEPNHTVVMNVIGEVRGRHVIIIDDMIDTAGTLVKVAEILKEKGCEKVVACCTHAILSDPAIDRIKKSPVSEIITTDSLPMSAKQERLDILKVLSIAPLIGDTIHRIFHKQSLSELFV